MFAWLFGNRDEDLYGTFTRTEWKYYHEGYEDAMRDVYRSLEKMRKEVERHKEELDKA